MEASQINQERFGGNFPDSQKIEAGDHVEVTKIEEFTSNDGIKGVSLIDKTEKRFHTTAKQPVGYILSESLGLKNLIKSSGDGAVSLYFTSEKPLNSSRTTMLKCSIYKSRG